MERIAQIDKPGHLLAARGIQSPAALLGIACKHSNRIPVEPGEAGDQRTPVVAGDLKNGFPIKHQPQQAPDVESELSISRNDRNQLTFAAFGIVRLTSARR